MRRTLIGAVAILVTVPVLAVATVVTAPTSAPAAPVTPCLEEDGSTPGQAFPCRWDGGPNGLGLRYILTGPAS